jgi:hypothetical protein
MTIERRLARLEQVAGPDRCPYCQSADLAEPGVEELATVADWTAEQAVAADLELHHRARLAWCRACRRDGKRYFGRPNDSSTGCGLRPA